MAQCVRDPSCTRRPVRRGMCAAHYEQWRNRQHAYGRFESVYVDAEPARQHVRALIDAGIGIRRIAQLSGIDRKALQILLNGRTERGTPPSRRIAAKTASAILAVVIPEAPHRVASGGARVDAIGTIRRLQSLVAFGYPRAHLGQRIGWSATNIGRLLDQATGHVNADTARKVEALFRELQLNPGPSVRARNDGARRGWSLPFDWDEDELDTFTVTLAEEDAEDIAS